MQFKETSGEMKQTGDQVTIDTVAAVRTLTRESTRWNHATDSLANQTICERRNLR